jgi:hypothetical protein
MAGVLILETIFERQLRGTVSIVGCAVFLTWMRRAMAG